MTEHKFTDDEIIRAFKCCSNADRITECGVCPYYRKGCLDKVHADAADLINRQKAEIEDLEIKNEHLVCFLAEARKDISKEFAERLKYTLCVNNEENYEYFDYSYTLETIDNLVKEMTEGEKEK